MLTSGPRYGTCKGTVLTSNVLDRHSITVISNKNKNQNEMLNMAQRQQSIRGL